MTFDEALRKNTEVLKQREQLQETEREMQGLLHDIAKKSSHLQVF